MATFTNTLPDDLLNVLAEKAKELSIPKNKLIEKVLRIYLDQLNRAVYVKSYMRLVEDADILQIAKKEWKIT